MRRLVLILLMVLNGVTIWADIEIFKPEDRVEVKYKHLSTSAKEWKYGQVTLSNAFTEALIKIQLLERHPRSLVRILSAKSGESMRYKVYFFRKEHNTTRGIATYTILLDAATRTMCRNQLKDMFPNHSIRIYSYAPFSPVKKRQ